MTKLKICKNECILCMNTSVNESPNKNVFISKNKKVDVFIDF